MKQYFEGWVRQKVPMRDLAPPTFGGITGLTANQNGSLSVAFTVGADQTPPLRYRIYIKASTAVGLFDVTSRLVEVLASPRTVFEVPVGTLLQKGVVYHVGVRAVDGIGQEESNTVSLSAVSEGVLDENALTMAAALTAAVSSLETDLTDLEAKTARLDADAVAIEAADVPGAVADIVATKDALLTAIGNLGLAIAAIGDQTTRLDLDADAIETANVPAAVLAMTGATADLIATKAALEAVSDELTADIAGIDATALQAVADTLNTLAVTLGNTETQLEGGVTLLGTINTELSDTLNGQLVPSLATLHTELDTFNVKLGEFDAALDRLNQSIPGEPDLAVLQGNIRSVSGKSLVWEKVDITVTPVSLPQVSGTSVISYQRSVWYPNYLGNFEIPVVKGSTILVEIPLCALRFKYEVPLNQDTIDFVAVIQAFINT